jgi:hypothetical protein
VFFLNALDEEQQVQVGRKGVLEHQAFEFLITDLIQQGGIFQVFVKVFEIHWPSHG